MNTNNQTPTEQADAEQVDNALRAINDGHHDAAGKILLDVISRAPASYTFRFEDGLNVAIKFWDKNEFLHYVTFLQDRGLVRESPCRERPAMDSQCLPAGFLLFGFLEGCRQTV